MKVYLMQHALAVDLEDGSDRVVSQAGEAETVKIAKFAGAHVDFAVDRIYHSGKTRARRTAELFAREVGVSAAIEIADGLAPMDDPAIWAKRLSEMRSDVMLVGHLPHISRLTAVLATGSDVTEIVKVRNSGLICLEKKDAGWRLDWMIVPDCLR
ncbi:MAG: phosphohistidine phosphatase SixA [candidate division Zixibacteria bacterium]|nr:phosphohistidine phosphatase SixA [candidate division Zixibacteria bacterium]